MSGAHGVVTTGLNVTISMTFFEMVITYLLLRDLFSHIPIFSKTMKHQIPASLSSSKFKNS